MLLANMEPHSHMTDRHWACFTTGETEATAEPDPGPRSLGLSAPAQSPVPSLSVKHPSMADPEQGACTA